MHRPPAPAGDTSSCDDAPSVVDSAGSDADRADSSNSSSSSSGSGSGSGAADRSAAEYTPPLSARGGYSPYGSPSGQRRRRVLTPQTSPQEAAAERRRQRLQRQAHRPRRKRRDSDGHRYCPPPEVPSHQPLLPPPLPPPPLPSSVAAASPQPTSSSYSVLPDPVQLRPVLIALGRALALALGAAACAGLWHVRRVSSDRRHPLRRFLRAGMRIGMALGMFFAVMIGTAARGFYLEATGTCAAPTATSGSFSNGTLPPLVEYYVHGRGNGHYARSVAVIEGLNDAGIDVRIFVGRATMWRAVHEAHRHNPALALVSRAGEGREEGGGGAAGEGGGKGGRRRGTTTAISVTSLNPSMDLLDTLSHVLERVAGDCEVAQQTGRHPDLVVTDGDLPGMLRAWLGGVPSVGISHGQTFHIGRRPTWVRSNKALDRAWERQRRLNRRAAVLTNWQIGTNFVAMETDRRTGVIARSPMRPEALEMARERWRRRHVGDRPQAVARHFLNAEQRATIDALLSGTHHRRRKLVICYFRDKNGDVLQDALLRSGFDVLLFERGYHKGLMDIQGVEKFGNKWIVRRDEKRDEELRQLSHQDYWRSMLADTGAKLLDQDDGGNGNATAPYAPLVADDTGEAEPAAPVPVPVATPPQHDDPRIIRVTDMSLFVPLLSVADGVASSAGSQLISECIFSDTPILSLYRQNDDEQHLNIEVYRHMAAGSVRDGAPPAGTGPVPGTGNGNKVVHGISLEEFSDAFSWLHLADPGKIVTKEQRMLLLRARTANRAHKEFEDFVDAVTSSGISSTYYEEMGRGGSPWEAAADAPGWRDPFEGMNDPAQIIVEVLKEVVGDLQ